jgi:[acyl-carrier-protein] S-malonyltransferase
VSHAFLFPGQGSEGPDMGGAALSRPGPVRTLVERASRALDLDLERIISRGDRALARTEVGQPALVAVSLGLALELQASGVQPSATAGHSVGEIAAFALAGCLAPEDAIDCVVERARLMADAARRSPGSMAAIRALSLEEVHLALELGAGRLDLAAHNSPEEFVLTGGRAALAAVHARFHAVPLSVSGPWHSRAMADAGDLWRLSLQRISWQRPRLPLVCNATGLFVRDDHDLVELLAGQLSQPVQWAQSLRTLCDSGIQTWNIFGPGRVLRGLCRANLGASSRVVVHDGSSLQELHP